MLTRTLPVVHSLVMAVVLCPLPAAAVGYSVEAPPDLAGISTRTDLRTDSRTWRSAAHGQTATDPVVDYTSDSGWQWSRVQLSTPRKHPGPMGRWWRHSFELVLTRDKDALVIHDELGAQHRFENTGFASSQVTPEPETFASSDPASGSLRRSGPYYRWERADGTAIDFAGSLPIRMQLSEDLTLNLTYSDGVLIKVSDSNRHYLEFVHEQGLLSQAITQDADQVSYQYHQNELISAERSTPKIPSATGLPLTTPVLTRKSTKGQECADDGSPVAESEGTDKDTDTDTDDSNSCTDKSSLPVSFKPDETGIAGARRIDLRPASCESYFVEFYGTERGDQIEAALNPVDPFNHLTPTSHSFPAIDFFNDHELIMVTSRDLASTSLDSSEHRNALFNQLMRDGELIRNSFIKRLQAAGSVTHTEQDQTITINDQPSRELTLQLIVRHGMADPLQIDQILRARQQLKKQFGISLKIIEIP